MSKTQSAHGKIQQLLISTPYSIRYTRVQVQETDRSASPTRTFTTSPTSGFSPFSPENQNPHPNHQVSRASPISPFSPNDRSANTINILITKVINDAIPDSRKFKLFVTSIKQGDKSIATQNVLVFKAVLTGVTSAMELAKEDVQTAVKLLREHDRYCDILEDTSTLEVKLYQEVAARYARSLEENAALDVERIHICQELSGCVTPDLDSHDLAALGIHEEVQPHSDRYS